MRKFYKILTRLKKRLKPDYPVLIYIVEPKKLEGKWGETTFTGKRYVIKIVKSNWDIMIFILLHEFAHIITPLKYWTKKELHGEEWAKNYGVCWKVYTGEL